MEQHNPIPTLNHLFFHHLDAFRHDQLLVWQGPRGMVAYSSDRFAHAVFALRNYLLSCGLVEGDRVAVFSENRPEWHIAEFAILLARQIVVPVYATLAPNQVQYLLENSGCRVAIISGERQWAMIAPMLPSLPHLELIIVMDDCGDVDAGKASTLASLPRIVSDALALDQAAIQSIRAQALSADPQSVATIVYTSGTTAKPKGVMLSHRNITFDLERCLDRLGFRTTPQALSVLPLPHVFERLLCYGYFRMGVPIAYGDPHDLKDLLKLHRPVVMGCVPRVLEKIHETVEAQVELMPGWRRALVRRLFQSALEDERRISEGQATDRSPLFARVTRWLLARRIRRQFGGLHYFICGGAWLDPAIETFTRSIGFVVLQGYGMTETSPVITFNELGREKLGSVGPALDGVEVRINEQGEIMTRGPHVMLGYYNNPEATRAAFRDGWLLTGDLGSLDEEGFLGITGRGKELLALSNGKKVCGPLLEQAIESSSLIQRAFVIGERRKFTSALIVPHLGNLARMARERGIRFHGGEDLLHSGAVWELVRQEIEARQAQFSNYERVKRFCFLGEEALLDPEVVTPTQKMRRDVLERKYAASIAQMYGPEDLPAIARASAVSQAQDAHVSRGTGG